MATITDPDTQDIEQGEEILSPVDAMLEKTRTDYEAELEKLRPAHEAFLKLERLVRDFQGIADGTISGGRASGDRASRGQRPAELLALVKMAGPEGLTVAEAAKSMGTGANYLYRIANELTEKGDLIKDGKRYMIDVA